MIKPAKPKIDIASLLSLPIGAKVTQADLVKTLSSTLSQSRVERRLAMLHTQDPFMLRMINRIRTIAYNDCPVLITGPTGTGKELLASACVSSHYRESEDETYPFIDINCGALNVNLVESTFFGHVRGAFTGADKSTDGLLVQAGNGIVFLDEIGELPLVNQAALLRAIQENEIRPVGSANKIKIKCRFVAATKHDLSQRVEQGLFRDDLYARISIFRVRTTGLKERPDDIPYIAKKLNYEGTIPDSALPHIYKYNVRGLQAVIENMRLFNEWLPD